MFDQCTRESTALFCMVAMAVHPWAATGAAVGCCFLLFAPMATAGWQRLKLIPFSFGTGYAGAVFFYGRVAGQPWNEKAMLVAVALSALSAVTFTVDKSGPLPAWLESILDRIPLFKRRGGSDGV